MNALIVVFYVIHVLVSLFLVLVVLLQQGKGADLSVFGGGSTQAAFGARGAATLLHKLTVGGFVLFTLTTLSIAIMEGQRGRGSVLGDEPAGQVEQTPGTPPPEPPSTPSEPPAPQAQEGEGGGTDAAEPPATPPDASPESSPDSP